jgi:hypothetical protein
VLSVLVHLGFVSGYMKVDVGRATKGSKERAVKKEKVDTLSFYPGSFLRKRVFRSFSLRNAGHLSNYKGQASGN